MKVLFVNGCIRAEKSRTLGIAESFLEAFSAAHQDVEIVTEDLNELRLEPLYHDTLEARDKAAGRCEWDNEMFAPARRFREADLVVIAAPFWEGTFPAAVHTYIEHVCVTGLTFKCTERGYEGLCRAENAVFITTRGGIYSDGDAVGDDHAAPFLRSVFKMLGIKRLHVIDAEGLDIPGCDIDSKLGAAKADAERLAENLM